MNIAFGVLESVRGLVGLKNTELVLENKINNHFADYSEEIATHNNKNISLEFRSATVRPKYNNKRMGGGFEKIELPNIESSYDIERDSATTSEKVVGKVKNDLVLFITLDIVGGECDDILPLGIPPQFLCLLMYEDVDNGAFTLDNTHISKSDKVKIKMEGSNRITDCRNRLFDVVNFIRHIQTNIFSVYITTLLIFWGDDGSLDEEIMEDISPYLCGKVDIDRLALIYQHYHQ